MAKIEGRGNRKRLFFKNQEMNFTILRALTAVYDNGAAIGEILNVVQNTKKDDINFFVKEWRKIGDECIEKAVSAYNKNDLIRTKEFYLRASNYYKSALNILNPLDKRHKEFWQLSKNSFEKAGELMENPLEYLPVPYEGKVLPCYFISANKNIKSPVIFLVTGGEGTNVEMYFWMGAYALKNGYSVFLYEGPGNISTMYTSSLTMIPNSEKPIGKALDILTIRNDVDVERIALLGISFGGYLVSRAAAFDKRIKAIIPDSPIRNIGRMLNSVFPSFIFKIPEWVFSLYKNKLLNYSDRASLDLVLWDSGSKNLHDGLKKLEYYTVEGLEHNISCPTLALAGEDEGINFNKQAKEFLDNINSNEKMLRIYKCAEGANFHCQVNNTRLMNQEVIQWLNMIFNIQN